MISKANDGDLTEIDLHISENKNFPKPWNSKNMSSVPPPLPARPNKPNHQTSCVNEFDSGSENEETYEPPPSERPLRAVTTIEPTNNYYIERQTKPSASSPKPGMRQPVYLPKVQNMKSESDPARMHDLCVAHTTHKGPAMNKPVEDIPPVLPPRTHRQTQLDLEDITDGEYLEFDCKESNGNKSLPEPRLQPSIPPRGANLPTSVTKPPVPLGKPLPHKTVPSSEEMPIPPATARRISVNQTQLNIFIPTPFTQSVPSPNLQEESTGKTSIGMISSPNMFAETTNLSSKSWFASKCDRKTAEAALYENGKDGAFLVRPSSGCDKNQPYTLAVLCGRKVYNIPIRLNEYGKQCVLGKEKAGEQWFNSIGEMIDYYQGNSLILIDRQNNTKNSALLLHPVQL
ncbi:B-cell linker protein-like isoform X2 [Chiloscyllium plagiosum]|uniref:B-cell linker protein-like isoform X2 n=1 Tax=Chiloscyllium plagiosum TaxID=36176 RepID=UPI001CB7B667|nr:B-cell linker protein-like isoform X2 [Chiloscyllium plagiosum]